MLTTVRAHRDGVGARLAALVEAERECCSFLGFELEEQPHAYVLRTAFPVGGAAVEIRPARPAAQPS